MNINTFKKLPENGPVRRVVGELFLDGERMVGQKTTKIVGNTITYYRVISVSKISHEYEAKTDTLTS